MHHFFSRRPSRVFGEANLFLNDSHVSSAKNNAKPPKLTTPIAFLGLGFRVERKNGDPSRRLALSTPFEESTVLESGDPYHAFCQFFKFF